MARMEVGYSRLSLTQAAFVLTGVQHTDLIFIRNSQDLNTVRETLFDDATSDRYEIRR